MANLTFKSVDARAAIIVLTFILLSIALLPWGAAREWHVALSFVLLGVVSFGAGIRLARPSWTIVGLCAALSASGVFILGEIINRGGNYWIFGLVFYTPVAIFVAFVAAGIGRALKG